MRIYVILIFIILTLIRVTGQDVFTTTPNQAIQFGTSYANLQVTGLNTFMNSNYGLEKVRINITHEYLEDLTLTLVAPNNTEILLSAKNGGDGTQYDMTWFTGVTTDLPITAGSPPYIGSYQPEEQLGVLNNGTLQADGIWKLKINDDFFYDDGTLHSFSLTFSNNPAIIPSAPNDDCDQATNIIVNQNYNCTNKTTGNIVDATASVNIPLCNISALNFDDDIWFKFTANATAQDFVISNIIGTTTELIYQVLAGNCQSLSEIYCDDGTDNVFSIKNLTVGNQYYLRVASKTENPNQNISFDICIKEGIPDPPSNDECINAIEIPNTGGCPQVAGSISGATGSSQSNSCQDAGSFSNDVWFYFVANQSNLVIKVSEIIGVTRDLDFQLSHGSCANLSQDLCFFEGTPGPVILIAANNLTVGETYYLRIASFNNAPKNTKFKLCIGNPSPPPPNDNCANAINLIPDLNNCTLVNGTLDGATGSSNTVNCNVSYEDYFDDDIWFKFTATATAHGINIYNLLGSTQDLIFEVSSGTCGNFIPIKCQDDPDELISLDGLTIGQVYYIRIASYFDLVQNTTFDICIGKNNLLVTNTLSSGEGSLRFAVASAVQGDTIKFAANLNGATILLASPSIVIDKELVFHNAYGDNVKLGNSSSSNTDFLMIIQDRLDIKGLQLQGTSPAAMKIKVEGSGDLLIYEE